MRNRLWAVCCMTLAIALLVSVVSGNWGAGVLAQDHKSVFEEVQREQKQKEVERKADELFRKSMERTARHLQKQQEDHERYLRGEKTDRVQASDSSQPREYNVIELKASKVVVVLPQKVTTASWTIESSLDSGNVHDLLGYTDPNSGAKGSIRVTPLLGEKACDAMYGFTMSAMKAEVVPQPEFAPEFIMSRWLKFPDRSELRTCIETLVGSREIRVGLDSQGETKLMARAVLEAVFYGQRMPQSLPEMKCSVQFFHKFGPAKFSKKPGGVNYGIASATGPGGSALVESWLFTRPLFKNASAAQYVDFLVNDDPQHGEVMKYQIQGYPVQMYRRVGKAGEEAVYLMGLPEGKSFRVIGLTFLLMSNEVSDEETSFGEAFDDFFTSLKIG
jgi:hypothetical protein